MQCPRCGHENRLGARFCRICRQSISSQSATTPSGKAESCVACGKPIRRGAPYCSYCGSRQPIPPLESLSLCLNCGSENRARSSFCNRCGQSLGHLSPTQPRNNLDALFEALISCGKCGMRNRPTARFCRGCNATLEATIADNRLIKEIGRGGMGLVYSGVSEETGEDVVVKLLLSEHQQQPLMVKLFEESARLQQSLRHPNIAPITSVGRQGNISYIVQPFYNNGSLDQWFRQIDLSLAISVFRDVCAAVHFTHDHGAIHGDIKPSNVLIGEEGEVLLTDFMALSALMQVMMSSGIRWATPMYMAPEMLASNKPPDIRTDIYALGLLLFETIRGYLPRQSDTRMALAGAIRSELPLSLDPNYRWVNAIIDRAVNPDPTRRFASVAQVLEAIPEPPVRFEWPQYRSSSTAAWLQTDDGRVILEFSEQTYAIGKSSRCPLLVQGTNVADLHAEIEFRDGRFILRRINTSGPLVVNNEMVYVARVLHSGDRIRIEDTQFVFATPSNWRINTQQLLKIRVLPIAWLRATENGNPSGQLEVFDGTTPLVERGRVHIEVRSVAEKLMLSAVAPGDHVLVNQVPVKKIELSEGDVIQWAENQWTVHYAIDDWVDIIDSTLLRHGDVTEDQLSEIPQSCRAIALREYVNKRAFLDISFSEAQGTLRCNDIQRLRLFRLLWEDCDATFAKRIGVEITAELVHLIIEKLAIAQVNRGEDLGSRHGPCIAFELDISSVVHGINLPERIPLIFVQGGQFSSSDFPSLLRAARFHLPSPHLAIIVVIDEDIRVLLTDAIEQLRQHGINALTLGREDLQRILLSKDPRGSLRRMLLSKVDLATISPFVVVGPVRRQLFFGRETEMGRIVASAGKASFALVAGRRYGKTSTLQRLHNELLSTAGYHTLLYDCSRIDPAQPLSVCVVDDWKPGIPPNAPATLDDLLQWTSPVPMVLLLDEADRLVMIDRRSGWRTLSILRALANAGRCQVILGGERVVHEAILDPSTPLFNFVTRIPLGPLDFNAVEELITRPFRQMEIGFSDEKEVVRRCFEFTSGHPNIVQRLCARLVATLNLHNTRLITLDDVDEVIEDPKFQEEDFLQTYWSQASDLEQIITLLMAGADKPVRFGTILDLLASEGLQPEPVVVKKALDRLVDLRAILRRLPSGYEFAIAAFPQVLANTTTAEDLLPVLKSQYRQNPQEHMEIRQS